MKGHRRARALLPAGDPPLEALMSIDYASKSKRCTGPVIAAA